MNRNVILIIAGIVVLAGVVVGLTRRGNRDAKETQPGNAVASAPEASIQELLDKAQAFKEDRNMAEAKAAYQTILTEHSGFEQIQGVQKSLEDINLEIIVSNTPSPKTVTHEVKSGDTLGALAKQYGTTVDLIKKKNNLKSDVIRVGQKLSIWTGKFNIFVDKSQNVLILRDDDEMIKTYQVSTGKDNGTPVGEFKITTKLTDPVWFKAGAVVPPESPENELGSRWLGFDLTGYGIHGTIHPESIGQQITAGCVRMRNSEVEELFSLVPTGTKVAIVD